MERGEAKIHRQWCSWLERELRRGGRHKWWYASGNNGCQVALMGAMAAALRAATVTAIDAEEGDMLRLSLGSLPSGCSYTGLELFHYTTLVQGKEIA